MSRTRMAWKAELNRPALCKVSSGPHSRRIWVPFRLSATTSQSRAIVRCEFSFSGSREPKFGSASASPADRPSDSSCSSGLRTPTARSRSSGWPTRSSAFASFRDDEDKMNSIAGRRRRVACSWSRSSRSTATPSKGRRPSFVDAARPEVAMPLYRAIRRSCFGRAASTRRDRRVRRDDGGRVWSTTDRSRCGWSDESPARHSRLGVAAASRAADARRHRARGAAGEHRRVVSRRRDAARARRASGAREGERGSTHPDAVTIGSDTIVVVDGDVLGKPRDRAHAARDAAPPERAVARRHDRRRGALAWHDWCQGSRKSASRFAR